MKLRPEEITSILKERIEQYDVETDLAEVGTVLQIGDGIARLYGLENCVAMEMLDLEHGVVGLAFNLEEDDIGAASCAAAETIVVYSIAPSSRRRSYTCATVEAFCPIAT